MHRDEAATLRMLADLKDGDMPIAPGDSIVVGGDTLVCSKVYGWKDGFTFAEELAPARFLQVSWFRNGAKRAEKVNLNLPRKSVDENARRSDE